MGTIALSTIIASARITLLDPSPGVTWVDADFIAWANEAQRAIVTIKPNAYRVKAIVSLVAGSHQALPTGGLALLDIYENITGASTPGRRCLKTNRAALDETTAVWPMATPEIEARHWLHDAIAPDLFEVYPPNDGTGKLRMLYAINPPVLTAVGDLIGLDDAHELAIKYFLIGQAYSANTQRQDTTKAAYFMGEFYKLIGMRAQGEPAYAPRTAQPRAT